jgi:hypothetical protein
MPQDHQQELMQPQIRITYILRTGKCHSATGHAATNQDHLHTEDVQMPQDHQPLVMQP